MGKVKVAIIGVGNCASSLVQGLYKYVETPENEAVSGVMHNRIGDYRIEDIEVVPPSTLTRTRSARISRKPFSLSRTTP